MPDIQDIDILYNNLDLEIPFCFIKMNDGECAVMDNPHKMDVVVSRGDQTTSELLSQKLIEALNFQQDNYFVGVPCKGCDGHNRAIAKKHIANPDRNIDDDKTFINANILINSNVNRTLSSLKKNLSGKPNIVLVTNSQLSSNVHRLIQFGITPSKIITVKEKNAFETDYPLIKDEWITFPDNTYVLCLCGPLGRVLCYEWFKNNSTFTCLELGSLFDPILKNRSYSYHQGTLPFCSECFSKKLANMAFDDMIPDYFKLHTEIFYFNSIPEYLGFYGYDINKIYRVLRLRFKDDQENVVYKNWMNELNDKLSEFVSKYKKMTKSGMYNEILHLFNISNWLELDYLTKLYLSYFGQFSETNTRIVKFYYGVSNLHIEPSNSIQIFEELLKDKELEKENRAFIESKLVNLYHKCDNPIPKVIHLIYFKEREICTYHLRCIESVIRNMPDYKIIIHNDIEPLDNEFWLTLKQYDQVEIVKRDRPREFDGFHLHYVQYQADVTRLEILYEYGGIYLDLDILLLKNFEEIFKSNHDFYICKEVKDNENEESGLINSFLAAKPKNEFLKIWLDNFKTGLRMDNWAYHIRETNKILIQNNPHYKIKYGICLLDHEYFFPFPWYDRDAFDNKREIVFDDKTYGIHLFDTILHDLLMKNEFFPGV